MGDAPVYEDNREQREFFNSNGEAKRGMEKAESNGYQMLIDFDRNSNRKPNRQKSKLSYFWQQRTEFKRISVIN